MPESADVVITTVTFILIITSIVGNSLVCAVIMRNRDMRIPMDYLLVNLAVSEIMYSTFHIPKVILRYTSNHPEGATGKVLCTLLTNGNISWVGAACSIFSLIAIAIERYCAVVYPYGNSWNLTMPKLKVIIPVFWIFSVIFSIPDFVNKQIDKIDRRSCTSVWPDNEKWIDKAYFYAWFALVFISFTLMAGLYSRVVYSLWFNNNDHNVLVHQQRGVLMIRKRVTLMVVTISSIFVICWGTDEVLHVVEHTTSYKFAPVVLPITHTMIMFNSAVNPFAYALISQRFRKKMKGMICCRSTTVLVVREPRGIELTNIIAQLPTDTARQRSTQADTLETNAHTDFVNPLISS